MASGCWSTKVTNRSKNSPVEAKSRADSSYKMFSLYGWKCKSDWSILRSDLFMSSAIECLRADVLGPWPVATAILSVLLESAQFWLRLRGTICWRNRGSKILYPVPDGVIIRNCYMPPVFKISSEYSLHYCHRVIIFEKKVFNASALCTAYHWSMFTKWLP